MDVVGARHNRSARFRLALIPHRQIAVVYLAIAPVAIKITPAVAGMRPKVMPDVVALPARFGNRCGMLGTQNDRTVSRRDSVVVAYRAHSGTQAVEYPACIVRVMIGHAVRMLGGEDKDSGILRPIATFDVIGRKRARLLVLGDAVRVLARMAQRAFVEQTWPAAADIEQHQAQRAANGRIRAVARPKYVAAGV